MDLTDNQIVVLTLGQLKGVAENIAQTVIQDITQYREKVSTEKIKIEKEFSELAMPVTDDFCKRFFNVKMETLMNRRKKNPNIVIHGEGQEKFMFKSDAIKYVKSLGVN